MNLLTFSAPAKLNLSLRVLGRREDGFHEIDTVMVKLPGLADSLDFREADEFSFHCDDPSVPNDGENLVVKAVKAYEVAAQVTCRYAITLRKVVPHGAGLGGGSSDAAATFLALDQLHGFKLGPGTLHKLASALGSDIPFFLTSGAAHCTGRGEKIVVIASPPRLPVLLLKPAFNVPTPDAYGRWQKSQEIPGIPYSEQTDRGVIFINDLERPVFEKHRFLGEVKYWLLGREETTAALMSGSGSTIFAVLKNAQDADAVAAAARRELDPGLWHWSGFTAGDD